MSRLRMIVLTTLSVALTALLAQPVTAAFPGANGRIAFFSNRSGRFEIHTLDPRGGSLRKLTSTNAKGGNADPAWSPQGRRIVFIRGNALVWMNVSNGERHFVVGSKLDQEDPSWSPNGKRIVFGRGGDIFTIRPDGTGRRRLTSGDANDWEPDWSPVTGRIVFSRHRGSGPGEIFTIRPDGTGLTRITDNPGNDDDPDWHPTLERIVFMSSRDGDEEIFVMRLNGTKVIALEKVTANKVGDEEPAWSPTGMRIAFETDRNKSQDEIYDMKQDGTNVRRLTTNAAEDDNPDWQPLRPGVATTEPR